LKPNFFGEFVWSIKFENLFGFNNFQKFLHKVCVCKIEKFWCSWKIKLM